MSWILLLQELQVSTEISDQVVSSNNSPYFDGGRVQDFRKLIPPNYPHNDDGYFVYTSVTYAPMPHDHGNSLTL
jgi:hypothetical protein